MFNELIEIRNKIDSLIENCKLETRFEKVGEIYGEKGKYALYLSPKETEKKFITWYEAVDYCKSLGGELPTLGELEYLYDNHKEEFQRTYYWSSSQGSTYSWLMVFRNGDRIGSAKTNRHRVRAVRRVSL